MLQEQLQGGGRAGIMIAALDESLLGLIFSLVPSTDRSGGSADG